MPRPCRTCPECGGLYGHRSGCPEAPDREDDEDEVDPDLAQPDEDSEPEITVEPDLPTPDTNLPDLTARGISPAGA